MLMNCGEAAADPAQHRLVGHLRPGHREPEPARLHRHVPRRLSDPGDRRTGSPAFLPGVYQGTYIDTQHTDIEQADREHPQRRLTPSRAAAAARPAPPAQRAASASTRQHDAAARGPHPVVRAGLPHADARRPRRSTSSRSRSTIREMYGPGTQARQLLIARRLLERGVRFVQVWHGAGQPWDNHDDLDVAPSQARPGVRPGRSPRCSPT